VPFIYEVGQYLANLFRKLTFNFILRNFTAGQFIFVKNLCGLCASE
jgi:hypothetical protein